VLVVLVAVAVYVLDRMELPAVLVLTMPPEVVALAHTMEQTMVTV
jgi:hypothetical protein